MDDLSTILIIAVGIIISIIKAKNKNEDEPIFEEEPTSYDYEEEGDLPMTTQQTPTSQPINSFTQSTISPKKTIKEKRNTTTISAPKEEKKLIEETSNEEFQINSVEEARKAIIWGEILQRKHF